jgi:hypothetical protein
LHTTAGSKALVWSAMSSARTHLFTFLAFRDKILPFGKMTKGASPMDWVTPEHEEIDLNCEVSSYANAEL